MNRNDLAGAFASLGIFLLAFGVSGSVPLDTPMLGEVLGLSTALSLRLAGIGIAILLGVVIVGSLLKEDTESE